MNILFFGAHPDDLEILCGGTIARCVAAGHEVWMAVATNGNVGSPHLSKEEIAAIRKDEATEASHVLGAKGFIWMEEDDEFLFDDKRTRLKVVEALRKADADIVVTHSPTDYHPDHNTCSKLVTDARILSAVRLIETESPHLDKSPELFYMDSVAGINFSPEFYVDVTATFETKLEALACHRSQAEWIQSLFQQEISSLPRTQAAFRGLQCGVPFAEAFVQPAYWPRQAISLPFI